MKGRSPSLDGRGKTLKDALLPPPLLCLWTGMEGRERTLPLLRCQQHGFVHRDKNATVNITNIYLALRTGASSSGTFLRRKCQRCIWLLVDVRA